MTSARGRSKERVPTRLGTWLSAVALGVAWVLAGCYAPPSVTQRVSDAARDLNLAARFGDLEGAAALAAPAVRAEFLARRALWGGEIRILDVELQGLRVDEAAARAFVEVNVSWMRTSESALRVTRIAQVWRERDGDWLLTQEERVAGDVGVFGEPIEVPADEPQQRQFETRRLTPVIE